MKQRRVILLVMVATVLILAGDSRLKAQDSVAVNPANTHQTWIAWGGTATGPGFGGSCATPPVLGQAVNDLVNDLGLTRLRLELDQSLGIEASANDNSDPFNINMTGFTNPGFTGTSSTDCNSIPNKISGVITPFRNAVQASGGKPIVYMSMVNYTSLLNMPLWWQNNVDEGSEVFHAFAMWLNSNYGFYPDSVTWNEPGYPNDEFGPGGGNGTNCAGLNPCPSWMGGWVLSMRNRLSAAGIPTKVEGPTEANNSNTIGALNAVNQVPGAQADYAMIAFHCYGCGTITDLNNVRDRAKSLGVPTGMTEWCCGTGWTFTYDGSSADAGKAVLDWVYTLMTQADISVFEMLAVMNTCSTSGCLNTETNMGRYISIDPNLSTYYKQPYYYELRQYFHYVLPGYVRVDAVSSNDNLVKPTAWKRQDGGLVIVVHNDQSGADTVTVSGLPNLPFNVYQLDPTMCGTTGTARCTPVTATMTPTGGSLTLPMPGNAVWTLAQASVSLTLSSVSLNPTSVVGGSTSQGTVSLTGAAPSGGAIVSLSSGNSAVATVPASVTIPAGATSATFTVTTTTVTVSTPVTISASYSGSTLPATLTVTVTAAADFSLSATPTSTTITAGQTANYTLSITPSGGFNQAVSISCTGAPQLATCTVTPNSVTLNGSSASTASVAVTTTARSVIGRWFAPKPGHPGFAGHMLPWLLWLFALATWVYLANAHRSREGRVRLGGLSLKVALLYLAIAATIAGCSGAGAGSSGNPGTPPGSYTIKLTGTSGSVSHSTNVTLAVN